MNHVHELLKHHKVLIFAGSGGVGKTTLSAAFGIEAARFGLKTLVLTIDPAKRLKTALGLDQITDFEVRVNTPELTGELYAAVIDSKKIFDEFVVSHVSDPGARERILKNRLYDQLSTTLSGSQEYTALEKLYQIYSQNKYDLIILDTPPAQHAVEFLRAPQKMYALFQSAITKWFIASGQKKTGLMGLINKSTKTVFNALETLTGAEFLKELGEFFEVVQALQDTIRDHSAEAHRILTQETTRFMVVTGFDENKISEARVFERDLLATGYSLAMVIVNRAFPEWTQEDLHSNTSVKSDVEIKLNEYYQKLKTFYSTHQKAYDGLKNSVDKDVRFLKIPEFDQTVNDVPSLLKIADEIVLQGANI